MIMVVIDLYLWMIKILITSLFIFVKKPTYEQLEIINYRAILFERVRPYKYLDENFKYLGFEEYEVTTKNKKL